MVQDVFMTAYQRLGELREPAAFGGWLAAIARNRAADHGRRLVPVQPVADAPSRPRAHDRVEALAILEAIRSLPAPPPAGVDSVRSLPTGGASADGPVRVLETSAVRFGTGDVVVHHRGTGAAHHLNGPAAEVYERCDGRPVADLVDGPPAATPSP